jgi:hypothetical protein
MKKSIHTKVGKGRGHEAEGKEARECPGPRVSYAKARGRRKPMRIERLASAVLGR